jgi:hypothetical protein
MSRRIAGDSSVLRVCVCGIAATHRGRPSSCACAAAAAAEAGLTGSAAVANRVAVVWMWHWQTVSIAWMPTLLPLGMAASLVQGRRGLWCSVLAHTLISCCSPNPTWADGECGSSQGLGCCCLDVYLDSTACKASTQRHPTLAYKAGHARKAVSTHFNAPLLACR